MVTGSVIIQILSPMLVSLLLSVLTSVHCIGSCGEHIYFDTDYGTGLCYDVIEQHVTVNDIEAKCGTNGGTAVDDSTDKDLLQSLVTNSTAKLWVSQDNLPTSSIFSPPFCRFFDAASGAIVQEESHGCRTHRYQIICSYSQDLYVTLPPGSDNCPFGFVEIPEYQLCFSAPAAASTSSLQLSCSGMDADSQPVVYDSEDLTYLSTVVIAIGYPHTEYTLKKDGNTCHVFNKDVIQIAEESCSQTSNNRILCQRYYYYDGPCPPGFIFDATSSICLHATDVRVTTAEYLYACPANSFLISSRDFQDVGLLAWVADSFHLTNGTFFLSPGLSGPKIYRDLTKEIIQFSYFEQAGEHYCICKRDAEEGLLTVTSQQNVDNKQTTLRVMGAQQNDQNLNHTSRSTTRAVPSTELAEVSTSRRTTDEYSTAIMTTETTVSTTIQQHKSTTDTPTIGIHTTELEPLQQTPSEESTIIADSLTKQRQESTTYTPSVTASQEPLLSRHSASTPVNTLLSTAETLLDHLVPLTVEVDTPYTTVDTTEGSLTVTSQQYVDNKHTTPRVMGTQQNDQNLDHTSRSTTRALEPLQQTPSEETTIIADSLTKQQQESTTYTPSVTASQEPLLSRHTASTPVNTLLSTAETVLDHSVPFTVEVATPYTTVDTTDAGDCTGACEPSSTFQERLSNATVEQAELIINGSKLTAEEIVTVQEWFLNPQYVEGTEEELHSYTMGYLKIFDGIIASSNEETFDIANPAAFADACNSILENYANKTSSNNTRLSFPNIECEVVQISTDSFDGFTSTLTSDNQDEKQLQGFIGIQNDWVVDYANETDTSTMEIISVLYQTSSVEEFRTVDDNEIVSSMVSLTVLVDGKKRSVPVVFGLELDERKVNNVIDVTNTEEKDINLETICVFWDTTSEDNGFWNTYGCTRKDFNKSYVECTCNHTTNFAILMQVTEVEISQGHSAALSLLSLIGLGISTAALICTILILMWLPSLKSDRVLIHKHLVIALIIAQVLFMSTAGAVRHELICKLVAIFMHYFYLAVFVWMLIEGVHLYLEIVQVFSRFDGKSKTVYYIIGGWGFPFIIVAVSVAIRWRSYGEGQGCWLSIDDGLIWAFLGPVVVVILVNFLILLMVVRVVYRASSARGKEDAEYKHLTAALKGALFLLPLLGLSWVIGFMSVNEGTLVFQYLFVIFNSLQGFFIFLFYCAINKEVRGALSRRFSQVALESGDSKSLSLRAVAKLKSSGKSTSPVLRFTEDTSGAVSKSFDQKSDGVTTEPISASGISVHQNKAESQQNLTQKEDSKSPFSPDYD